MSIHQYFMPAEDLTDDLLLERRATAVAADPDLARRAAHAAAKLDEAAAAWALKRVRAVRDPGQDGRHGRQRGEVTVRPVYRPEPDLHRMAQALLAQLKKHPGLVDEVLQDDPGEAGSGRRSA